MNQSIEQGRRLLRIIDTFTLVVVTLVSILLFVCYLYPEVLLNRIEAADGIYGPRLRQLLEVFIENTLPICVVFILTYVLARTINRYDDDIQNYNLAVQIDQQMNERSQILAAAQEAGFLECLPHLDKLALHERIAQATQVCIMTTWLSNVTDLEDAFTEVVQRGGSIRILMMNPSRPSAEQRSVDLGRGVNNKDFVPNAIRQATAEIEAVMSRMNIQLEHRYYNGLPIAMLYICDDDLFVALFPHGNWSERGPVLHLTMRSRSNRLDTRSLLGAFLKDQFTKVWEGACCPEQLSVGTHEQGQ